jgi:signal peptidase
MDIPIIRRRQYRSGRILVNTACILFLLAALVFIVPSALGYQRYVITGGSMGGTLDVGSVAFEEVVPVTDLEVGDVVTYLPPPEAEVDHLVTHRIVDIDGHIYRTKGDANSAVDPWTFELTDTAQPRVSFSIPYVGYAFLAVQDRGLRILLIGLPATVIALISLGQLVRALRRRPAPTSTTTSSPSVKPRVAVGG